VAPRQCLVGADILRLTLLGVGGWCLWEFTRIDIFYFIIHTPLDSTVFLKSRLNIKYISLTLACTMLILITLFLFDFMRVGTFDFDLVLTLRGCDLEYFTSYGQFSLLIYKSHDILIQ
jgi:hypothetical protein